MVLHRIIDFGDSCNDYFSGQRQFPLYGVPISYYRCAVCGFTFTNCLDTWSPEDFHIHIYNGDYLLADPPFSRERPYRNSLLVAGLWHRSKDFAKILDFGGGDGRLARHLSDLGFKADSHDAFYGEQHPAEEQYDIVTCFEVIEHVPHSEQDKWLTELCKHLSPQGVVLLSTELIDQGFRTEEYYVAPRNGHISIHSAASLQTLAARHGLTLFSVNSEMHFLRQSQPNSAKGGSGLCC